MAEYKISRIRYTWKGDWQTTTAYNKDDVVKYGGSTWICVRQHTASAFLTDQEYLANPSDSEFTPSWIRMTDGRAFRGNWAQSTAYAQGDLVLYGGVLYIINEEHTSSSTFLANATKTADYVSLYSWREAWAVNTRYGVGDVIQYNGIVYKCIVEHTSGTVIQGIEVGNNDSEDDSLGEHWEVVYEGIDYVGNWSAGITYRKNDLVKYGGSIFRVTGNHTSSANIEIANFVIEFPGNSFNDSWNELVYYAEGDVVRHGGYTYRANITNIGDNPALSLYSDPLPAPEWSVLVKATNLRGDWSASESYKTGDLVRRGGNLYTALLDTEITADGSTLDYLDASNWELAVKGIDWKSSWNIDREYEIGDLVDFIGSVYRNNTTHTSSNDNYPGDNGSGFTFWDLVLLAGDNVGLRNKGDLLTYDLSRGLAGDTSTFGPTNIPIGQEDQVVQVDAEGSVGYNTWGNVAKFVYVAPNGVDDETDANRGINPFKPFKTIRFACEHVEAREDSNFTKISVAAGEYKEVLPIVIPAGTAVQGVELRSTIVKPNDSLYATSDRLIRIAALNRFSGIIQNVLSLTPITRTPGNTETQNVSTEGLADISFDPKQYVGGDDISGAEIFDDYVSAGTATSIQSKITEIISFINFRIDSSGVDPTLSGSNTATTSDMIANARLIMQRNRTFLATEVEKYISVTYPEYTDELCAKILADMLKLVDAFRYDIYYTGNYRSLREAKRYTNSVLGSKLDDMFYCRNSTGLRDMTVRGLNGTLNPPNVFELYRRPTGGSFVSLDPGWGPDDNKTWITTRSPYVQNVTTFGDNCVGQKIDGSLHNGGNKSIVSNDFTQVISDGVGAWVLNNGRAELVSVFTYYAQIGMFAERGGVIRATNGNSSYGDYGSVADGNDPTESPRFAEVNNRVEQAEVASAFAGEVNDEILILEYNHAGENYSFASYSFQGAGVNASVVHEEIRDDSVFQALVKNAPGDSGGTEGAGGYSNIGNNAQLGTLTTLTLATNDNSTEAQLLGLRLLITSGQGAGQYGYVDSYNPITLVVNVLRESDGKPGWDHVIPGTPIRERLFTDNTYRFEPRPVFSDPGFVASDITLPVTQAWNDIVYGETEEVYNNIAGSAGTGEVIGVTPVPATFDIVKVGRKYTVAIDEKGAGYEAGQIITINGSVLGGVDTEHDIIITVRTVSDDSTNSITSFDFEGTGNSGKFVALPLTSNTLAYSSDAETWDTSLLAGNGIHHGAAGNNRFVAIRKASDSVAYSLNGSTWTTRTLPVSGQWTGITHGNLGGTYGTRGVFLAVAEDGDKAVYSRDGGITWTQTTLPDIGDSSFNQWIGVAYGKGKFVAVANSGNFAAIGEYNYVTDVWTWSTTIMDVIADSSVKDWQSIAYGNNRWVVVSSTGDVGYSLDAQDWFGATMPSQDGSTAHFWKQIRYGQGVFFAVGSTGSREVGADLLAEESTFAATSYGGDYWTERQFESAQNYGAIGFGNPDITLGDSTTQSNSTGTWVALTEGSTNVGQKVYTGCKTRGRIITEGGNIKTVRLWEPGSGYRSSGPTLEIIDPKNTSDAYVEMRTGDAVLAQPGWINRGVGYRTSSTTVEVLGDGFADILPNGQNLSISGLELIPGPGAQFRFRGDTVNFYTVQSVVNEAFDPALDGTLTATFRVTPKLTLNDFLEHTSQVEIRERYSQVRITGHDFLDVGTGNFAETNYPAIYADGAAFTYAPENEVYETAGGRVFYVSTDQSGNFRCGELFAVEQATGIVTISADFFDFQGLTELALGGVRLGGSGAVVREFSTDPLFTQDSNNVVPTQRAIASYLQNRLNVGGSDLLTASFIAGTVKVGPGEISNVAGLEVTFPKLMKFEGEESGISGSMIAQTMFFRSFDQ
jgi:hypothetical protein